MPKQVSIVALRHPHMPNLWLFGRRIDTQRWTLPGGHANPGEDKLQAARRELVEETGVRVDELKHAKDQRVGEGTLVSLFVGVFPEHAPMDRFYNDPDQEFCDLKFLDPQDDHRWQHEYDRDVFKQWLDQVTPSHPKQTTFDNFVDQPFDGRRLNDYMNKCEVKPKVDNRKPFGNLKLGKPVRKRLSHWASKHLSKASGQVPAPPPPANPINPSAAASFAQGMSGATGAAGIVSGVKNLVAKAMGPTSVGKPKKGLNPIRVYVPQLHPAHPAALGAFNGGELNSDWHAYYAGPGRYTNSPEEAMVFPSTRHAAQHLMGSHKGGKALDPRIHSAMQVPDEEG